MNVSHTQRRLTLEGRMEMKPLLTITVVLLAAASGADERCLPDYWEQSRYLVTGPTTGGAESALLNPALWALLPGPEAAFQWSDVHASAGSHRMWSLAIGLPYLGFGAQRWTATGADAEEFEATDYQLALGVGDRSDAFGVSYGWSKGDMDYWQRPKLLTLGTAWRPSQWLSLGTATTFALGETDRRLVADLGLRVPGTDRVTLFAEGVLHDDESLRSVGWAAGALVEPVDGLRVSGRLVHPNSRDGARTGTTFQLGFGLSLGDLAGWVQPHYDDQDELAYTSYGVRAGYGQPSAPRSLIERDGSYLKLGLKGRLRYRPCRWFCKDEHHFLDIVRQVREAHDDPRVAGVVMNISGLEGSWEMFWELRDELEHLQDGGKTAIIFMDDGGMKEYYLASVADRLVLDPEAVLLLPGVRFGRTYVKGALEKLGLGFREFRFFRYKTAAEAFSRTDLSDGDKEQLGALVEDWYAEIRDGVCEARPLSPARYDSLIDNVAAFTAEKAVSYGLADTLARWGEVKGVVKALEGKGKHLVGGSWLRETRPVRDTWGRRPTVAIVYALGPCAMDDGIAARSLVKTIRNAREDKAVKAVVFRADSPGGEVIPSDMVKEELAKTAKEKPVLVSQGQVAGSGGYWISLGGQRIVTSPFSITGSIGAVGGWVWNDGIGDKLGLTADLVKLGRSADLGFGITLPVLGVRIPDRDLDESEQARAKDLIMEVYDRFVQKVADVRGISPDEVRAVAQGRVWSGRDALEKRLVDDIGGLLATVDLAKEAAGIPADEAVELREMPPRPLFDFGFGRSPIGTSSDARVDYLRAIAARQPNPVLMTPPEFLPPEE
jgi:protease-4